MTQEATLEKLTGPAADMELRPRQTPDLDITETDDGYIIYEPETDKVHHLNPSAVLILELCDGSSTALEIAEAVREVFQLPSTPIGSVTDGILALAAEGLVSR
jgi:hypothetical protein